MIWLRRVLAIPLIFLFVLTFVLGLVLCHLSGTVGSAGFYNGQMRKAHVYDWIHDSLLPAVLDEAGVESPTDFPIDTPEMKEDILTVAETTFPPEWLEETFEGATKQIVPYVVGDRNSFAITIDVQSRIDPMADGIKDVVDGHATEIYDYVTSDLIVPAVTEQLALGTDLPYGIALTDEEITDVVAQAMPQDWAIAQFKSMIDSLAAYLKGDVDNMNLAIVLTDVKSRATTSLNVLTEKKLTDLFEGIQTTCASEAAFLSGLNPDTLPSCKPAGYNYSQFKQALEGEMGMTFAQRVKQDVIDLIPNSYYFDQSQLEEALGEDLADTLDSAREFIVDDQGQITDQDLRESDDESNVDEEEGFDNARQVIHSVKMWIWALWFISILLLVAIGFLCGRNWKSRLLWPLCVLFITSLIFVVVVAVARAAAPIPDRIVERPEGEEATHAGILVADKADEVVHNAIDALVWGLELKLILFIVFSGLAIAGVIAWMVVDRRRRQKLTQGDSESPSSSAVSEETPTVADGEGSSPGAG
ncbi:MAG: hypothetical protein JW753_00425 [Dehalococcoidia bacterium]|nr:hypothetical protein [Dehalococcoidia bacterium]